MVTDAWVWVYATRSGILFPHACRVHFVQVIGGATAAGCSVLYSGLSTSAVPLVHLPALANTAWDALYPGGLYAPLGLYLSLDANHRGVVVAYEPEERPAGS
jgi:hypothetical protein